MDNKRKILVVDDAPINRIVLKKILLDKYDVIEAANGQEALDILNKETLDISLVLLDLMMPVLDGYGVMAKVKENETLSVIPIIVITGNQDDGSETKCLQSGASDFIKKPFNSEVVRNRVDSMIRLRENAILINQIKNDFLTGLYTREFFTESVKEILQANPDKQYDLICCDVVNFKMINERWGRELGDKLLCTIAAHLKEHIGTVTEAAGRIDSNTFIVLKEHSGDHNEAYYREDVAEILEGFPVKNITIKYGIYAITDKNVAVTDMCDRAVLALRQIKHKYGATFWQYDDRIRLQMLEEEKIVQEMEVALKEKQFKVFFQPKHDVKDNAMIGAEALVRWRHPVRGLIPPGVFIPIFERNGFITKLDSYVWEETPSLIRQWLDEGHQMIPISVNISRMDFGAMPLEEYFPKLMKKYNLSTELYHLEVTETAYMDDPEEMVKTVVILRQNGFRIEMDDFGTGYSSLNLLSDLPIDALKVGMNFVRENKSYDSNKGILSFILNLSKWLGVPTIVEGVETKAELRLVATMGCDFVQGYYFAKPMPEEEFIDYLDKHVRLNGVAQPSDK